MKWIEKKLGNVINDTKDVLEKPVSNKIENLENEKDIKEKSSEVETEESFACNL